jgi:hypothetical protein
VAAKTIHVRGLKEVRKALRDVDKTLGPELRKGLNEVAELVLDTARPLVPHRSGDARASLKAGSTETAVQIKAGGSKAPYWGWLDFGGTVGEGRVSSHVAHKKAAVAGKMKRRYIREGRYIYPTLRKRRDDIEDKFYDVIDRVTKDLR